MSIYFNAADDSTQQIDFYSITKTYNIFLCVRNGQFYYLFIYASARHSYIEL